MLNTTQKRRAVGSFVALSITGLVVSVLLAYVFGAETNKSHTAVEPRIHDYVLSYVTISIAVLLFLLAFLTKGALQKLDGTRSTFQSSIPTLIELGLCAALSCWAMYTALTNNVIIDPRIMKIRDVADYGLLQWSYVVAVSLLIAGDLLCARWHMRSLMRAE